MAKKQDLSDSEQGDERAERWLAQWRRFDFSWHGLSYANWTGAADEGGLLKRWRAPADFPGQVAVAPRLAKADLHDVLMLWDVLDRLAPELRLDLIRRLDEITAPGARLYTVVDASGDPTTRPLRYTLLGTDRVGEEELGPPERAWPSLLPAQVERLLAPFDVVRAFTLRTGKREYVAVKGAPRY